MNIQALVDTLCLIAGSKRHGSERATEEIGSKNKGGRTRPGQIGDRRIMFRREYGRRERVEMSAGALSGTGSSLMYADASGVH